MPPDSDNDGLYDLRIACLWIVEAPDNNVVRYNMHFYETEAVDNVVVSKRHRFKRSFFLSFFFIVVAI